jgi:hypothetical protein
MELVGSFETNLIADAPLESALLRKLGGMLRVSSVLMQFIKWLQKRLQQLRLRLLKNLVLCCLTPTVITLHIPLLVGNLPLVKPARRGLPMVVMMGFTVRTRVVTTLMRTKGNLLLRVPQLLRWLGYWYHRLVALALCFRHRRLGLRIQWC